MGRLLATEPTLNTANSSPASTNVAGAAAPLLANTKGEPPTIAAIGATAATTKKATAATPSRFARRPGIVSPATSGSAAMFAPALPTEAADGRAATSSTTA